MLCIFSKIWLAFSLLSFIACATTLFVHKESDLFRCITKELCIKCIKDLKVLNLFVVDINCHDLLFYRCFFHFCIIS